jgi:hypothetical protein
MTFFSVLPNIAVGEGWGGQFYYHTAWKSWVEFSLRRPLIQTHVLDAFLIPCDRKQGKHI